MSNLRKTRTRSTKVYASSQLDLFHGLWIWPPYSYLVIWLCNHVWLFAKVRLSHFTSIPQNNMWFLFILVNRIWSKFRALVRNVNTEERTQQLAVSWRLFFPAKARTKAWPLISLPFSHSSLVSPTPQFLITLYISSHRP